MLKESFLVNRPPQPPVAVQSNVRELRLAAGLSQQSAAERFDLSLRVWQTKEAAANPALLSQGEYELLLLLAGRHPHFVLAPQNKK
ncbi:transcriptional regulator [Pantoea sp. M_8]|uniref:Transcriptional regulator n=1 Tax=Pantoea anthophila TaxID=470931 RepID=A0ABY2Z8I3_9GAMM|nr:transcriptional regulator [Pantoea sp. M_6]KAA5973957.1 transcriptional regulator [Pantoea sp. M_8]KAA6000861.1 transcriptional regulator [Pantoea sp. M_5]TPV28344.1 transcriptional regulator [Pantoea anthophila]